MYRVGVIGASGKVGKGTVEILQEEKIKLRLGGRHPENIKCISPYCEILKVDIFNPLSLSKFVHACDIVINCTGPIAEVGERIARICCQNNIIYIDVAGNQKLYNDINKLCIHYPKARCVMSAGIYPGLVEIFASWVLEKNLNRTCSVEGLFYGNNQLSYNAARDICETLRSNESESFSYLKENNICKIDFEVKTVRKLPGIEDKVYVIPIMYNEFATTMKNNKVVQALFYHSFSKLEKMEDFISIKEDIMRLGIAEDSIEKVRRSFYDPEKDAMFLLIMETEDYTKEKRRYVLFGKKSWNLISGMVAGLISLQMLNYNFSKTGLFYATEIVNAEDIISKLISDSDITIRIFQKSKSI